jgi:hypothetical protein
LVSRGTQSSLLLLSMGTQSSLLLFWVVCNS